MIYFFNFNTIDKDGEITEHRDCVCYSAIKDSEFYSELNKTEILIPILDSYDEISEQYYMNSRPIEEVGHTIPEFIALLNEIHPITCEIEEKKQTAQYCFPHFEYDKYYKVSFVNEGLTRGQSMFLASAIRYTFCTEENYLKKYFTAFFDMIYHGIGVYDSLITAHYYMDDIVKIAHSLMNTCQHIQHRSSFDDIENRIHDITCQKSVGLNRQEILNKLIENKEYEKFIENLPTF